MSFTTSLSILTKEDDARRSPTWLKTAGVFLGFAVAAPMSAMGQTSIQEPSIQERCAMLVKVAQNEIRITATKEKFGEHVSNFCDEYRTSSGSSRSRKYGVSYKFLSLSSGGQQLSHENVYDKYCENTRQTTEDRSYFDQYNKWIPPEAWESYNNCLSSSQRGIVYHPNPDRGGKKLVWPISFAQGDSTEDRGSVKAIVDPDDGVECHWVPEDTNSQQRREVQNGSPIISIEDWAHVSPNKTLILTCGRTNSLQNVKITMISGYKARKITLDWSAQRDVGNGEYVRVSRITESIKSIESRIQELERLQNSSARMESGIVRILHKHKKNIRERIEGRTDNIIEKLWDGEDIRGMIKGRIDFKFPFSSIPKVVMAIHYVSSGADTDTKLEVIPVSIDKKGFTYSFITWNDSKVWGAGAMWLAYGK